MNYGELIDLFKKRLNRRDITPSLVESFIRGSIQRTQRLLRTPGSEAATIITFGANDTNVAVPGDYLQMVSICVDDGEELARSDLSTAIRASRYPGIPQFFARNRDVFVLGPRPNAGAQITIIYHADFANLSNDTDTNWLTEIAPDVIIDGALSKACQHYRDPRGQSFEDTYVTAIIDMNNQATLDETVNAQVSGSYNLNFPEEL